MAETLTDKPSDEMKHEPLWQNRDFLLLWSGQAVSVLGTGISGIALPLLMLALTGSPAQAGLLVATGSLPYLVFGLPAGALVDRWNRKTVMIACDLLRFVAAGSVPLAYVAGRLSVAQLFIVALVSGTAWVFFSIANTAAILNVVPKEQLAQATGLGSSSAWGASVFGPGLGGFIINLARNTTIGATLAYLVDSFSYLASVLSLTLIRIRFQQERSPARSTSIRADIVEGLSYLRQQNTVRILAWLGLASSLFSSPAYLAIIVLARTDLHVDARTIGLIFSIASVAGLLGSFIASSVQARLRLGHIIVGALIIQSLSMVLLATSISPVMLVLGWGLISISLPIDGVAQITYRLSLIPDNFQGRVGSLFQLLFIGGAALGTAAGGLLLTVVGPRIELAVVALCTGALAATISFTAVRRA